jgi:acetylglutamate kinase
MSQAPDPRMLAKAETLAEALPYLQRYAGRTFVVKYGAILLKMSCC